MPVTGLDKAGLKSSILTLLSDMEGRTVDSKEEFATRLSDAIDVYVKTAKIKYDSGLIAPGGAVTGTFNGELQ